jgi:hypothetical protein
MHDPTTRNPNTRTNPNFSVYDDSSRSFVGMVVAWHFRIPEAERCPSVRCRTSRNRYGFWLNDAAINFAEEYLSLRLALVSDYAEISSLPV